MAVIRTSTAGSEIRSSALPPVAYPGKVRYNRVVETILHHCTVSWRSHVIGETLGNRYKLLKELGAGGMAWVYLAEDLLDMAQSIL